MKSDILYNLAIPYATKSLVSDTEIQPAAGEIRLAANEAGILLPSLVIRTLSYIRIYAYTYIYIYIYVKMKPNRKSALKISLYLLLRKPHI